LSKELLDSRKEFTEKHMLSTNHTRRRETPEKARESLAAIDLIIANSRSFATASFEEINATACLQRIRLVEYKNITSTDLVRRSHYTKTVGCSATIQFRKDRNDPNTTAFDCGDNIAVLNTPHICCICEALLSLDSRRRQRPRDPEIQRLAFEEESLLLDYRNRGLIKTKYLGQYVEIERQRRLRRQEEQFLAFRSSATGVDCVGSAALARALHYGGTSGSESDNEA
jgi:hypothetical protein